MGWAWRLGVLLALVMVALVGPSTASAESLCTDTWIPAEGEWSNASNWSASHVPTSTDVACIGSGKTASSWAAGVVGVVQGPGTLELANGTLEVANALEPSTIASLVFGKGKLIGAATVEVASSLSVAGFASVEMTGSLVLESGAVGSIGTAGAARLDLIGGSLTNDGTLTIGSAGGILGSSHPTLTNGGTLVVNGEPAGSNRGIVGEGTLVNTGTVEKTSGSEASPEQFAIDNKGLVEATAGTLELAGGGTWSGGSASSWSGAGGTVLIAGASSSTTLSLGTSATMTGAVEITAGLVSVGQLEASGGIVTVSSRGGDRGTLEVNGTSASTIGQLTLTSDGGTRSGTLAGTGDVDVTETLTGAKQAQMIGTGTTTIEPGASGTAAPWSNFSLRLVERMLKNEGTLMVPVGGGILGEKHATLLNAATFILNGEPHSENHGLEAGPGEATLRNTGTVEKTAGTGTTLVAFAIENEGSISVATGRMELIGGGTSGVSHVGSWSAASGASFDFDAPGLEFKLGSVVPLTGSAEIFTTVKAGAIHGAGASITVTGRGECSCEAGLLELNGEEPTTLENLTVTTAGGFESGTLTGSAKVDVSNHFEEGRLATLSGTGETVLEGTGAITSTERAFLSKRTLLNSGTLTVEKSAGLQGEHGATLINTGTLVLNGENIEALHGLPKGEGGATLKNFGLIEKNEGTGTTTSEYIFENFGPIKELTGHIHFEKAMEGDYYEEQWGADESPTAGGDLSLSQTDLEIGGRGVGLNLVRAYNSQAAVAASEAKTPGAFGYGWSPSFSDHLVFEPEGGPVLYVESSGGVIQFTKGAGETFTGAADTQDVLHGSTGTGYTLTLPSQTVYRFSGAGRLEAVTDRNGNQTALGYNGEGQLTTITDPASRKITLVYKGGLVESATDPAGHVAKYTYEEGRLTSVTLPGEESPRWQYKYNGSAEITEMTDGRGGKTTYEYKASEIGGIEQLVSETDPAGRTTSFEFTPLKRTTWNHATGAKTVAYFSSTGGSVSTTHGFETALASTEVSFYDEAGEPLETIDGNGHATRNEYDAHSDLTKRRDPNGNETKWTYNETHDILTETTPRGETTTYKRDVHGNPEVIERPAPGATTQTTKNEYDAHGEKTSMEDPLKRVWKYEYNGAGDKTAETDPEGDKRTWGYDTDSYETTMVSPRGHVLGAEEAKFTTTTARDARERPTLVVTPLKHETKYEYDGNGNVESETDPEGNVTSYTYDADDERTATKEPSGTITKTGYDGAGQITSQTDGNEHTTTYSRNVLEQVEEVIDPLERKTTKEYDSAGNLIKTVDAKGRTTTNKYDAANRLVEVSYSSGEPSATKFEYNADGARTMMLDQSGESTYEYDQLDRLVATKDGHGDNVGYEYDLANEPTKITYPNGKAVKREYDLAGRLQSVTDWSEHATKFKFDADSDLTATTFPAGTEDEDSYTYDETDAMSEVKMKRGTETLASLVYKRNGNGQVTKTTSKGLPGEEALAFAYDENKRLAKGSGVAYTYDPANNPTSIGSEAYRYDVADELEATELEKTLVASYTYDALGERVKTTPVSGPATTYGYNQAGDMSSVARPKEGSTSAIEDTYAYNGDGLRTAQTVSGTTTYLAWEVAEKLPLILSDGVDSYVYGPGGEAVAQVNSSTATVLYLHHDQQGSIRLLTDATGVVGGKCSYAADGTSACEGAATTQLGYDGQYTSSDTGLIYLRARYYDPVTAQFLSVDPEIARSHETYEYAADDPVNMSDPTGLIPWSPKVKEAIGKCRSWRAWHSAKSPFYGNKNVYEGCQNLLHLPKEVFGTGPHHGPEWGAEVRKEEEEECVEVGGLVGGGTGGILSPAPGAGILAAAAGAAFEAGCKVAVRG